jgi:hypothetical protein
MRSLWRARWDRWLEPEASTAMPSGPQITPVPTSPVGTPVVTAIAPPPPEPLRRPRPGRLDRGPSDEPEWWQRFMDPGELRHLQGPALRGGRPQRPKGYVAAARFR